jgi:hypothetical protein
MMISEVSVNAIVAFTMDTYSHIISGMQEDAMALLDGVMSSGVTRSGAVASGNGGLILCARSSVDQSTGLRNCGSWVRIPLGVYPLLSEVY